MYLFRNYIYICSRLKLNLSPMHQIDHGQVSLLLMIKTTKPGKNIPSKNFLGAWNLVRFPNPLAAFSIGKSYNKNPKYTVQDGLVC